MLTCQIFLSSCQIFTLTCHLFIYCKITRKTYSWQDNAINIRTIIWQVNIRSHKSKLLSEKLTQHLRSLHKYLSRRFYVLCRLVRKLYRYVRHWVDVPMQLFYKLHFDWLIRPCLFEAVKWALTKRNVFILMS